MRILSLIAVVLFVSSLSAPVWAGMVEDCVQEDDPDLRIDGCTAAIRSGQWEGKDIAWAYSNRGFAYNDLGEYRRAVEDFDQALRSDPGYAIAYNNRGVAFVNLGEYRRAIQDYDEVLRLDPGDAFAYNNRGVAYEGLGEYRRAIQDYDQALRSDPGYANAYYNRGVAYKGLAWDLYLEGRNAEALADVDRALADRPGEAATIDTRAHVLAALGRPQEALAEFERAMQLGGSDRVRKHQKALAKHGYYWGAIDGVYGPVMRAAHVACLAAGCRVLE